MKEARRAFKTVRALASHSLKVVVPIHAIKSSPF